MSRYSNRRLRLDLINNLLGAVAQAGLAWGASLVESGAWMLFATNLAGGAAACAIMAVIAAVRLILRGIRRR